MNETNNAIDKVIEKNEGLQHTLKMRQIVMVGVGGTIGTGLFLGSGYVLQSAGPGGMILAYMIGGLVMWLMMMCLGELASAIPASGQVQVYATEFINPAMGFTCGWINWLACAITITAQIVASSIIMKNIMPTVDATVWLITFTILLFGVNALSAKQYGESSFWFSSLKLVLIVMFAIIGLGIVFGLVGGGGSIGFSTVSENGGLFPNGMQVVLMTLMTAVFAYGGSDLFASTAGEMKNPKDIPRAVTTTTWVLIGSYVVSLVILSLLLPYNEADLLGSPFAYVFKLAGFESAELVINIIVLTSALTSGNYFVYGCTRYLWSLAKYEQAPKALSKLDKRKVPMNSLIVTMCFAALSIVASFVAEDTVYLFLICMIGGANVLIYGTICVCQYRFRKRFTAGGGKLEELKYKTPLFPFVPIFGVIAYVLILVGMAMDPTQTLALAISIPTYIILYFGYRFYEKRKLAK